MKLLLKNVLEKLLLVVFCIIVLLGNVLLIYNQKNKFENFDKMYNVVSAIDHSKYVLVKDIQNDKNIEIKRDNYNNFNKELQEVLKSIKIRESKMKLMDKTGEIEYTIYIVDENGEELVIDFSLNELKINDDIYETDYNASTYFDKIFN